MNKSAALFRKTEEFTLPQSGITVTIKRPDLLDLALASNKNEMPAFLRKQVIDSLNGIMPDVSKIEGNDEYKITADNAHEYKAFIDRIATDALVWPRVVASNPDVENGEVEITDIPFQDRFAIMMEVMPKDHQRVSSFRGEQNGNVELSSDVQGLPLATVNGNGH